MHKETSDKLLVAEGDRTAGITGFSSTGTECCMCIRNTNTGIKNLPFDLRIFPSGVMPPPDMMQCMCT